MPTNLTIDDTSPDIVYSPNWARQSPSDQSTDRFFQGTYHSALEDGAYANLTFSGSSIYIYGTKGPRHANYSIQFDNFIIFYSAMASQNQYQQPLFAYTFNTSGNHFVSMQTRFVDEGNWLDLDYITISVNDTDAPATGSNAASPSGVQSMTPPWMLSTSTASTSSNTNDPASGKSSSATSSTSTSSRVTLILSIIFGLVILAALLLALAIFLCNRRHNRRLARVSGSSSRAPFGKGSAHMRQRSEATATNSSKHVTFTYNQAHASSQASGFASPLHSPGFLLPPETFRSPISPLFDHGSTFPRDRDREQLLSPTSTVPSTFAGLQAGSIPATMPLRRSHDQPQPRPHSPWQGSVSATNRSDSPVSTNALLNSDRKAHQHHTPKGSGSTAQSRLQPSLRTQDHHIQQQQTVSAIMEHLNLNGSERDLGLPGTPLYEQALLQPPNPNPPPIGPLPAPPRPGSADRRPSIENNPPSINSHTKLEPNRPEPPPVVISAALNIDPNTFLIPERPAPRPPFAPRRPERPRDGGLLDWFGGLERKKSGKKDRDDGNSMQTNFLKM